MKHKLLFNKNQIIYDFCVNARLRILLRICMVFKIQQYYDVVHMVQDYNLR
jgi:hypothetical protein